MADNETHEAVVKLARGELEEHERINCWFRPEFVRALIDRLEAAHKREVDALKQRCAELSAEITAKDEVIKRLNDAIAEEQRRKMATAENSSAVGDAAKLREALGNLRAELWNNTVIAGKRKFELYEIADAALAAPPRNCDVYSADELKVIFKRELVSELPIANEHEKNLITITATRMIDTLFATTKEGGNDGNE